MTSFAQINKYLLVFLCLCCVCAATAQQNVKLPDILPPSPTAFAITRYGGINLGMQTGSAQYNLPIYTLSSRKLSLPVSLSYSSNGIKVDEIASRVGMSWSIVSGGAITRTVYDQPDELSTRLTPPSSFAHTTELYNFLDQAVNTDLNGTDTSPDIFSFNFNGYSGQFILNGSQVVQLTKTNLKIEFNAAKQADFGGRFRITTPEGVVYYFAGGANSTESSYNSTIGENCGKTHAIAIDNAWYLTKVADPSGDNIVLEYAALQPYSYPASISQSQTKSVVGLQHCPYSDVAPYILIDDTNCENLITTNSVYLTKITASNGNYLTFSYTSRQDLTYDQLLSAVKVFQYSNAISIKTFGFNYTYGSGTTFQNQYSTGNAQLKFRPFLTSVTETAPGTTEQHLFSFDYNNINGLPPRLSFAQDDYGYFNGANNFELIPRPVLAYQQFFPDAQADRAPNFNYAQYGLLTKIKYPTGGYDSIAYKAPTYTVTELPDPVSQSLYVSGVGADLSTAVTTNSSPVTMTSGQTTTLNSSYTFNGPSGEEDFHAQVYIYLINTTTGQTIYTGFLNSSNRQLRDIVTLEAGKTYILRCVSYGQYSLGSANLSYYTQGSVPVVKNKTAAGAIVDLVKTYDPVQKISSFKKYYYSKLSDLTASSGSVVTTPAYMSDYSIAVDCTNHQSMNNPIIDCGTIFQFVSMSSNSLNNLYAYSQHHINFQTVVESSGLNFENGGIEHSFTVEPNTPGEVVMGNDILTSPFSNRGVGKSGLETFTNTFIKKGSVFQSVKTVKTTYKDDSRLSELFYGYSVRKRYSLFCAPTTPPAESQFGPFDVKKNYIYSRWVYPDTVITTTFPSSGSNSFAETEITQYDNIVHLLPTRKTAERSNGKNTIVIFKYPADFAATAPYDLMYNTLHMWSPVVEQQEYLFDPVSSTSTFLQSTKTDYQVWNGNNSLIYPATISTKTGTANYDPRIQFLAYDNIGNVQSVSKANGPKISYIYGYGGGYPVAQVANADYAAVVAALGGASAIQSFRDNLNPSDATVNNFLAPLRTSPSLARAQVVTYTYKPLFGVTSTQDVKGENSTFEYDNFQRLINIKDKDGDIVKHIDYHYSGQ